jgi:predicted GIY-YIG superfamily endonuclease
MAWVYILRRSTGRHYIGSCIDLDTRFAQHLRSHSNDKASRSELAIVAKKQVAALEEARRIERAQRKKNPALAIYYLQR